MGQPLYHREGSGESVGNTRPRSIISEKVSRWREKSVEGYRAISVERNGSKQTIGFGL